MKLTFVAWMSFLCLVAMGCGGGKGESDGSSKGEVGLAADGGSTAPDLFGNPADTGSLAGPDSPVRTDGSTLVSDLPAMDGADSATSLTPDAGQNPGSDTARPNPDVARDSPTASDPDSAQANVLVGHWHSQIGPDSVGVVLSDLILGLDGTFQFTSGLLIETTYSRFGTFYTYDGRFTSTGETRILFHSMTAHRLETNDVRTTDLTGNTDIWKRTRTEGTTTTAADREYLVAIKIRNGQRTAIFRPADGSTATDIQGLAAPSDKTDDQLDFFSAGIFKKLNDTIGNVVIINQSIVSNQTWTANKVYRLCPPADARSSLSPISVSATLTIEPGTVIKAVNGIEMDIYQNGQILAKGTSDKPITFALSDDPGDNPTVTKKQWKGIRLNGSWASVVRGAWNGTQRLTMAYCNVSGAMVGIYADGGYVQIDHCTFVGNGIGLAVLYQAGDSTTPPSTSAVRGCTFQGNRVPVAIDANTSFDGTNHFGATGADANYYNGIYVIANKSTKTDVTWTNTEVPYVICRDAYLGTPIDDTYPEPADALAKIDTASDYGDSATELWIQASPPGTITFADNVAVKLRTMTCADNDCYSSSNLLILGEGRDPATVLKNWQGVTFTIYYDDATKGDTDHFTLAQPLVSSLPYWDGISYYDSDGFTIRYLSGPNIKYAANK